MRFKFLSLFAAALLLGACESTPESTGDSGSSGASTNTTPETVGVQQEVDGPTPGSQEDLLVNVGDRIFFGYNSSELSAGSQDTLQRLAAWMNNYPQVTVNVQGHCDERGTREYNLALGERRATAARNYLIALGVSPNRVTTISYGKERPAVLGSTEAAWAKNRRDQFVVN